MYVCTLGWVKKKVVDDPKMAIAHDVPLGVLVTEYQTLRYLEQKVTMRNGLKVIHVNSYAKKVKNRKFL